MRSGKSRRLQHQNSHSREDVKKPIVLHCDASTQGLGASLVQDGKPVAYVSRFLTKCEQKYAPIELECVAIVFGCRKFDQYIYGHAYVKIHSDHKPPEAIYRKSLLEAPKRLQRMMLAVQRCDVKVEYRPGTEQVVADNMPHHPDNLSTRCQQNRPSSVRSKMTWRKRSYVNVSEPPIAKIRQTTAVGDALQKLMTTVRSGWPGDKQKLLA